MKTYTKDDYCSYCGSEQHKETWPRQCDWCKNVTYRNPTPVVVMMVPVYYSNTTMPYVTVGRSWLIHQRNIEPKKGGWAFPSGYVDYGESWQQAAARELQEEVGLTVKPEDFDLAEVVTAPNGNMLIFCVHRGVNKDDIHFHPNDEVSAIDFPIFPEHQELCFPIHNEVWKRYLNLPR